MYLSPVIKNGGKIHGQFFGWVKLRDSPFRHRLLSKVSCEALLDIP